MTTHTHDTVFPFMIDSSALSGRFVRLDSVLNTILNRHQYPDAVACLLGQFMALGAGLATALKYDGIFTFEARGNGVVPLLVVDITSNGDIRGYANIDGDIPALETCHATLVKSLMGTGHMMFTVDQSHGVNNRYQGVVALDGNTLEECVKEYFNKSAQFISVFRIACEKYNNTWTAGAISIQKLPKEHQKYDTETENENWNRAKILLHSVTDTELTDTTIPMNDILYRLYHEEDIMTYDTILLKDTCRCNRDRMLALLKNIPNAQKTDLLTENGVAEVQCQYCSEKHTFTPAEIGIKAI